MGVEPMTVDRSAQGDDRRRAQLLEAAGRVFLRSPSGGLTLAAVAQEAGVSRRLMYHYFADLSSLYHELFDERIFIHVQNVASGVATTAAPADRIATAVRMFVQLPPTYRKWTLMAVTDALPAEMTPHRELLFDVVQRRWYDLPHFADLDPAVRRAATTMIVTNVCLLAASVETGHLTADQVVDIAVPVSLAIIESAHATMSA